MRKLMLIMIVIGLTLLFQLGCFAGTTTATTEITDANKDQVINVIVYDMIKRGFSVVDDNGSQISFKRDLYYFPKKIFDYQLNGTPEGRITLNVLQINHNVRIIAEGEIIARGRGYEQNFRIDPKYIQPFLDDIGNKYRTSLKFQIKWSSLE